MCELLLKFSSASVKIWWTLRPRWLHGVAAGEQRHSELVCSADGCSFWAKHLQEYRVNTHRREHLDALAEVSDEGHDGHLLHEPLDLTELHHEAILVRQAFQRLALLFKLPQHLDLVLRGLEAHQALHEIHRQSPEVEPRWRENNWVLICSQIFFII